MNAYEKRKIRQKAEEDAISGIDYQRPTGGYAQDIYDEEYDDTRIRMGYGDEYSFHSDNEGKATIAFWGAIVIGVIIIATVIAAAIVGLQASLVEYTVIYRWYIYVLAALTTLLMYFVGKGAYKYLNIFFYVGISALATRFFAVIVEIREDVSYIKYVKAGGFWNLGKYTLLYIGYIAVTVGVMMLITFLIRKKKSS